MEGLILIIFLFIFVYINRYLINKIKYNTKELFKINKLELPTPKSRSRSLFWIIKKLIMVYYSKK